MTGKIPEVVHYYCKGPQENVHIGKIIAVRAFPVPSTCEPMKETALQWTKGYKHDDTTYYIDGYPNDPIGGVRIVGLERRNEGGRAYKAIIYLSSMYIDGKWYYVDLREDILMECIREMGIKAGGELGGNYLWCQYGSQMRLIRDGGEQHKEAVESATRAARKKISTKDLIPGHVYRSASGKTGMYIGKINTIEFEQTGLDRSRISRSPIRRVLRSKVLKNKML